MQVADISRHEIGKLGRFMFDLILVSLTFLDQQVFVIIISYRLGRLFGIFGRYNDSRELGFVRYAGGMLDEVI